MQRLFLTILFLGYSLLGEAVAQSDTPSLGLEPARGLLIPAHKVDLHPEAPNNYLREVVWEGSGDRFTATCNIPFAWVNRQVLLHIAAAPAPYRLLVNGREAAISQSGTLAAEFNLTRLLNEGSNRLELQLLHESPYLRLEDLPHPERPGATRLISQPTIRLRDLRVKCRRNPEGNHLAEIALIVKSDALNEKRARIHYELIAPSGNHLMRGSEEISLRMRGEDTLYLVAPIPQSELWSPDTPTHYRLKLSTQTAGRHTEYHDLQIAFRSIEQQADGSLVINGEPTKLKSYRVDRPLTAADIEEIKYRHGCNLLYPLPGFATEELYALCDEMGIYCVAQTPLCTEQSGPSRLKGGNPTNDPAFRSAIIERAERTLLIATQHPSVIAFSLGENSANGIGLYEAYLRLKEIEQIRPILYLDCDGEWNSDAWPADGE